MVFNDGNDVYGNKYRNNIDITLMIICEKNYC